LGSAFGRRLEAIPGMPPDLRALPEGCSFAPRCRHVEQCCCVRMPPESTLMPGRMTRCLRVAGGEIDLGSPNLSQRSVAKP
jgi:peptide/nickel transport system ATP-binding protein